MRSTALVLAALLAIAVAGKPGLENSTEVGNSTATADKLAQAEANGKLANDEAALKEKAANVDAASKNGDKNATSKAVHELLEENNKTRADLKKVQAANEEAAVNSDSDSNVDTATVLNGTQSASQNDTENSNKTLMDEKANLASDVMTKGRPREDRAKIIRDMAYNTNNFKKSAPVKETPCNNSAVNETDSAVKLAELKAMLSDDEKNAHPQAQKEIAELIGILSGGTDAAAKSSFLQLSVEQQDRINKYIVMQRLRRALVKQSLHQ